MRTLLHKAASCLLVLAAAGGVVQAGEDNFSAPEVPGSTPWLAILFLLLFIAAALAVAFMNARRSHVG